MRNKLSDAIKLANKSALVLGSATAIAMMGIASVAQAQEAGATEEIVVTGIRGALQNSVDIKRSSSAIVDAVSAEDVGELPDSDVGEALGRIPGVAVSRQFGQGQQISIRGASSQYTSTLLNGHTVASTGWYDQQSIDRSFNYSLMPAEMVGGMKVYKSSQADIQEGGIGGTVIIESRKPLDLDANSFYGSVKGDYGTVSEEIDPELSALYSWKNEAETFGILAAAAIKDTEYHRAGTEVLLGWGNSVAPSAFVQEREREAFNVAAQFAPSDDLSFTLNHMSLDLSANNTNTSLFFFPSGTCESTNDAGVCTFWERSGGTGWNDINAWGQTWARQASMDSKTTTLDVKYESDVVVIDALAGTTKSEGGTDLTANYGWTMVNTNGAYDGTFDATGDVYKINIPKKSYTVDDFPDIRVDGPASFGWGPEGWSLKAGPNSDEETFARANLQFEVNNGAFKSVKTGFSWADHSVEQRTLVAASSIPRDMEKTDFWTSGQIKAGNGFKLPKPDGDAMLDYAKSVITGYTSDPAGFGTIDEENVSLYAMANFEADAVRGNFGLRYISTDISSDYHDFDPGASGYNAAGYDADNISTDKESYRDVLPSVNITFDLSDDVLLRTSAAQVISRPNYENLFASTVDIGVGDGVAGNEAKFTGNVGLKPVKATQFDIGIEWYYGDGNMISATYFIKDFSNFTTVNLQQGQSIGLANGDMGGADNWTIATAADGSGAKIEGIELQAIHAWDNGFGVSANYTYADGSAPATAYPDRIGTFSDSSKDTINLVGFWENDVFSARLAYNWRSEFMIREGAKFYGNRMHKDFGTLDLSLGYNVTENISLSLEAVNLTEEDSIQTGEAAANSLVKNDLKEGFPAWSFDGEARYMFGASFKF